MSSLLLLEGCAVDRRQRDRGVGRIDGDLGPGAGFDVVIGRALADDGSGAWVRVAQPAGSG
ncbi:hypothetical protein [Rhizohabitans arisaemae]|uniref:hypothetical protein n=1 Tax=Rhizohabitans arisaemae TaxID=2720610 RepID=UPI0024B176D9|nr:hypothetical protein [Rhizohabitans arisaemae]